MYTLNNSGLATSLFNFQLGILGRVFGHIEFILIFRNIYFVCLKKNDIVYFLWGKKGTKLSAKIYFFYLNIFYLQIIKKN